MADTIVSPDGRHVGCVEMHEYGDQQRYSIVIDGVRGKETEWVVRGSLAFSADSGRFTYQTQHDGRMFVALGPSADPAKAAEGKGYFFAGHVALSPDGKRSAYQARNEKGGRVFMVVDGKEGPQYDEIADTETVFSPDGKRLAYRATNGGRFLFVTDGRESRAYDKAGGALFSSGGERVAYRAKRGDAAFVVSDGLEGPRYEEVALLAFSAGGRKLAYIGGRGGKQMLVVDNGPPGKPAAKEYKGYDAVADVAFSPDGRRLGLIVKAGKDWRAVIDAQEGPPYAGSGQLVYSPDGKRVAHVVGRGNKQLLVVDGEEGPAFDGIGLFAFSPDSRRVMYAAVRDDQKWLVLDHKPFAPAGLFAFSPDGRHIAHAVSKQTPAGEKWSLALDGAVFPGEYDGFPLGSWITWDLPTAAHTVLGRKDQLLRVELQVGQP